MRARRISYAQRFEDLHLARAFEDAPRGFYVDVGSGHPVVDNVSFAFYLKGWRGVTVEPNPALSRLSRAVRPRDHAVQALAGAAAGRAVFYLVDEFHGLSTMVERHARRAAEQFGKASRPIEAPVVTLAGLCRQYAPPGVDFLKIDVEGAEADVLRGGDFTAFRPKVVLIEALAPYSLDPAWDAFEPLLTRHGYRFAFFDSLNRYYVAEEAPEVARRLADAPSGFDDVVQVGLFGGALADTAHPDHALAALLARGALTVLPLLGRDALHEVLTAGLTAEQLDRPVSPADLARAHERLCGGEPPPGWAEELGLAQAETVRGLYGKILESDWFRIRAGRIAASYSW